MVQKTGERIKASRAQQGLTLAGLGEKTGLSSSYLSQVERDKTTPSLATLTVIARALNVGLRYFFEDEERTAHIVRAGGQAPGSDGAGQAGGCEVLVPNAGTGKLYACKVTLEPHTSSGSLPEFAGEELIFVLSGRLAVDVGDEHFELVSGDSVHFDAAQAHGWTNDGEEIAILLWSRVLSQLEH